LYRCLVVWKHPLKNGKRTKETFEKSGRPKTLDAGQIEWCLCSTTLKWTTQTPRVPSLGYLVEKQIEIRLDKERGFDDFKAKTREGRWQG